MPPGGVGVPGLPLPPLNPLAEKLTEAQKKTLKEIHEKYGKLEKSSLTYVVREGEQTFDIILK
jgi:hypothetical protein